VTDAAEAPAAHPIVEVMARATLDLHGILTIALEGATPAAIAGVRRQVGDLASAPSLEGDLTLRWVPRLELDRPLRWIGREAAAAGDRFVVLRGRRAAPVRMVLPVERIGVLPLDVLVEAGIGSIPYLLPVVLLSAFARGWIPIHASAFVDGDRGILVTGWAKGGKTEALLGAVADGASYVGDEWVLISDDGMRMVGVQESMRVWDWQLAAVPDLGSGLGRGKRLRLGGAAATARLVGGGAELPIVRRTSVGDAGRRIGAILERQRSIQVPPTRLFPGRVVPGPVALDRVVLVQASSDPTGRTGRIDAPELARRTAATIAHELLDVAALDLAHRSVFPDRRNPVLDDLAGALERRLTAAFGRHDPLLVEHPVPADIRSLRRRLVAAID
jgi:hypothetical protein